jgi:predicted amidohydrolase
MRLCLLTLATFALHAETLFETAAFRPQPEGWSVWSQREETKPRAFVENGALAVSGGSNAAAYGGWRRRVDGLKTGEWVRFRVRYRAENVPAENWQIVARLNWEASASKRAGQPDYMPWLRRAGDWSELTGEARVPEGASAVWIELYLANAPQGTVWFKDIALERVPAPPPRKVHIASVNLRPSNSPGPSANVERFLEAVAGTVPKEADVIVLPEGITVVGTGKSYVEVAETIPGPTTKALGIVAKQRHSYIVAGIYEREGPAVYNTAVLIGRDGELAGKYRKVYLPREEVESGLTPGQHFPVFRTDFGTVGLMICYDVFFAEPARSLANQGADMILMPIWGGDETLAKARAIENGVFLVASGYDHPTYVMDPYGERLSEARQRGTAAFATVDLSKRYEWQWLGEMRTRRLKELRVDVPVPPPGLLH